MTMPAKLTGPFEQAGSKFGVSESDFTIIIHEGMECLEDLFFRLPCQADLEEFMEHVIFPQEAVRRADGGELATQPKPGYFLNDFIPWKRSSETPRPSGSSTPSRSDRP
jgi:hypothetical protein